VHRHLLPFLILFVSVAAWSRPFLEPTYKWSLVSYTGRSNTADLLELVRLRFEKWEPYYIIGLGLNYKLSSDEKYYSFEWSNQIVKHLENFSLFEFDTLITFRWLWFPWNEFMPTTLAFGEGFSQTTGHPSSERISQGIRAKFLNYLSTEVTFSLPDSPDWALLARIHHRSGIYGLISNVSGGSNYVSLGVMKRF